MHSDEDIADPERIVHPEGCDEPTTSKMAQPFLVIYVAWHPNFAEGANIGKALYDHYRRALYTNVAGGAGLPVVYRSTPAPDSVVPIDINLSDAETSAIVMLIDDANELQQRLDELGWDYEVMESAGWEVYDTYYFELGPAKINIIVARSRQEFYAWDYATRRMQAFGRNITVRRQRLELFQKYWKHGYDNYPGN